MSIFKMDDVDYDIDITEYTPDGEFLYKYATRTENGDLASEAIGFFQNLSITFKGDNKNDFSELYQELSAVQTDGTFNHDIDFESPLGDINQKMYPDKLTVPAIRMDLVNDTWWGEMTVKFIAVSKY